jgi:cyclophilin family peptidyl-prolyl cis-trans isomerase
MKLENKKKFEGNKIKQLLIIISISIILLIVILLTTIHFNGGKQMTPTITIETNKGNITIELDEVNAPETVKNFLSYVDEGFYNGTIFHRVIPNFMIQGGGFTPEGVQKKTKPPIKLESNNGLKNVRGTIAMARTNIPDSATSQFFINTVDNDFLNYKPGNPGYAVFGKVIEGMDVVDEISKVKTKNRPMPDWPEEDIIIISIKRI